MENNQNIPANPDFSDIPALGDVQGLDAFLNNEALAAQGLPVQKTEEVTPAAQPTAAPAASDPAAQPAAPAATLPASGGDSVTLTREQYQALLAGRAQQPQAPAQPQVPQGAQGQQAQRGGSGYSAQDQIFIANALARGYTLEQINRALIAQRGAQGRINPALEQRIAQVENYLKTQEYKNAETAFVNKITDFGGKWGLSEQDLVTFGNEALKHGINIAMDNVDLEMVFRAVYPDQYAIRLKRMTPTNTSQIYGGTSVPEAGRASSAKLEDAYVENFLKGAMPNQYGMLNKK